MKKKIMIVDDEPDIREGLTMLLEPEGYEVSGVNNGDEFVSAVKKSVPDLVILDIMMPGLTTHEIMESIKGKTTLRIIILTALRTSESEIAELKRYPQVVGYLEKPLENQDFLNTIKKNLK